MTTSRGSWLSEATILFFCWSSLSLLVRIWVKITRRDKWGLDDSTLIGGFVICILHISFVFWAISDGYGRRLESPELELHHVEKALYACQISYIVAIGMTKLSTAFFIARLTRYGPQIRLAYILATISSAWIVISVLITALRGNISKPWETLDGSRALYMRWLGIEVVGLVIEVFLFLLAINLIWGLKMSLQKRILVLGAFGCRLVLIPLIIIRLYYLAPVRNPDPTFTGILASIVTEAGLQYAFMSASITSLKPFLQPFHSGRYIVNTVGATGSGLRSNLSAKDSQDPYYELSHASAMSANTGTVGKQRSVKVRHQKPTSFSDEDPPRPIIKKPSAVVVAKKAVPRPLERNPLAVAHHMPAAGHGRSYSGVRRDDEAESVNSTEGSDQMIIRETKGWSVRYEDVDEQEQHQHPGFASHVSAATSAV